MANNKYTDEFKKEAVKLSLETDKTNQQLADSLSVKYKTLMNWIHKSMQDKSPESNKAVDYKSRYQELIDKNTKLQKELKQAQLERDILKKAAAYFASQSM